MANWKSAGGLAMSLREMRRAVELAPEVASIRHNYATLLASIGEMTDASAQFGEALRIKPDDTLAFYGLSQNSKFTESTELVRAMVALHAGNALEPARREFLAYGLAKVFDDLHQPEQAMPYAIEANQLGQRPFDVAFENAALDELQELARLDAFRRAPTSGETSTAPLFIVGMNRSGTTLVESLLSRHPDVLAQGEIGQIIDVESAAYQRRAPSSLRPGRHELALGLDRTWLAAQAQIMLASAARRASGPFNIVTDKLPENAVRLGLVARLFPKARVIHVRRHPLDAGVSNFFQRFSVGQGYSTRLDWIGIRTRQIADSMVVWKEALDLQILDVGYENLVADPEGQARRMIDFAGLSWTPQILQPERTQRSVLTASQWQVRQPIYRGSVSRWTQYERWLGPMIASMGGRDWIDREAAAISGQGA
jgi:tetratricopeptide (TPR) repeat protein